MTIETLFYVILLMLLGVAPLCYLMLRERKRRRNESRSPFPDKLMRPAGESLRLKVAELNDKLSDATLGYLFSAIFVPIVIFTGLSLKNLGGGAVISIFLLLIEAPFLIYFGRQVLKLWRNRANYELGFQGERAVGEKLNQLLAEGCRVYHDLTFEGRPGEFFNIDHAVLSPMGLFAVETKTRRKRTSIPGKEGSQIRFDGKSATMPWGENAWGLEQAQHNAEKLSQWLSKSTRENVVARPVLTYPGWYIKSEGKGAVSVLNPKQIRHLVVQNGHRAVLSSDLIFKIKERLDEKCRDIVVN